MEGYPKMAIHMGEYPELAIFRRFAALNVHNILYLQAELQTLELKFRSYESDDMTSGIAHRMRYAKDWYTLGQSIEMASINPSGDNARQWKTFLKIRDKLREYNAAIIQQKELARTDYPNKKDLKFLRDWMISSDMGNISLIGQDSEIWTETKLLELLTIRKRPVNDPFTKWIVDHFLWWYQGLFGRKQKKTDENESHFAGSVYHDDAKAAKVTKMITTILASSLPAASIILLYLMDTMVKRIGVATGLAVCFSMVLSLVTDARAVDIFAATAAFSAVQVVYIGSTNFQARQ